jgi:hypothetical protein
MQTGHVPKQLTAVPTTLFRLLERFEALRQVRRRAATTAVPAARARLDNFRDSHFIFISHHCIPLFWG